MFCGNLVHEYCRYSNIMDKMQMVGETHEAGLDLSMISTLSLAEVGDSKVTDSSIQKSEELTGGGGSSQRKAWHDTVTEDLRKHLVHKLCQAIYPDLSSSAFTDEQRDLVLYAHKVELEMHTRANSREEYYHLLAEWIYKYQKEEEDKRSNVLSSSSLS